MFQNKEHHSPGQDEGIGKGTACDNFLYCEITKDLYLFMDAQYMSNYRLHQFFDSSSTPGRESNPVPRTQLQSVQEIGQCHSESGLGPKSGIELPPSGFRAHTVNVFPVFYVILIFIAIYKIISCVFKICVMQLTAPVECACSSGWGLGEGMGQGARGRGMQYQESTGKYSKRLSVLKIV